MTEDERREFEMLNNEWLSSMRTIKMHMDIANTVLGNSMDVNQKLFELETKHNVKRKTLETK